VKLEGIEEVDAWSSSVLLPVGWHDVTIEEADEGSSTNGYPQIEMRFANAQGDIREWMVVIPSSMGRVKSLLMAAQVAFGEAEDFDPSVLKGKKLSIYVGTEESLKEPGKMRAVVKAFAPLSDHKGDPVPDTSDFGPPQVTDDANIPF